jgi:hypothetical protein
MPKPATLVKEIEAHQRSEPVVDRPIAGLLAVGPPKDPKG